MKILHLLQSGHFSGAENVVCQIIGMLRDDPAIEMVYCSQDGQIREALEERNITFAPVHAFTVKEVKRVIREQNPDLIHAHDMRASFVAALACGNIPLISHVHNNNFDSRGLSAKSIAYLLAAIKAKHIFWVSQSSFDGYAFHRLFGNKSTVLYNIIDVAALYSKMNTDSGIYNYDVIYIGRLTFQKDPERLMRVFAKVAEKLPSVKIAVVGTGDMEAETRALSNELNLQNNVEFLGFQSNPLKMLHDAKVMVMTSRWEGTPMCALESLAVGTPIVSTPTDGLKDLIQDGVNGFLSDDDEQLSEKIIFLINNVQKQAEISQNAVELSERYNDMDTYREKILQAYGRELLRDMVCSGWEET